VLITTLFLGVLVPALIAGVTCIATWKLVGPWSVALGLGLGYTAGHAGLSGWPPFPPADVKDWPFWFAAAGAGFGFLKAFCRGPWWIRWLGRALAAAGVPWLLVSPLATWSAGERLQGVVALGAGLFVFWSLLEALSERRPGASLPLIFWASASGTSLVLLFSGSASLGGLSGSLAAALGASVVLAWWKPSVSFGRGPIPVVALLLGSFWILGSLYAEVSALSTALLLLAPLSGWIGESPAIGKLAPWRSASLRLTVALILAGTAVGIALSESGLKG